MNLEARAESCFSNRFILKLDGRPCGKFEGRWFSEGIDVSLTGQRHWKFEKVSWLSREFVLKDAASGQVEARAVPSGLFTSGWDLELSVGTAKLVRAGWFSNTYEVQQSGNLHGRVDRLGACTRGWLAENLGSLSETDLLMTGLVYQVILQREQQAAAATSAGT
jgi:hypothetical protein